MDLLSDLLRYARVTGGVFLHAEFTAPWCLTVKESLQDYRPALDAADHLIPYHYVAAGRMLLQVRDGEPLLLEENDVVVLPHNDLHVMGNDLALPPVRAEDVVQLSSGEGPAAVRYGGGGAATRLVCGFIGYSDLDANPLIGALPQVLRFGTRHGETAAWIRSTFQFAAEEAGTKRRGSNTILGKVSELLLVEAVRRHVETLPEDQTGWLAGLKDPYVSRALAVLHARLDEPWTVEGLGREIGLSRSALAERFGKVIGRPPMQHLTRWRMQVAAQKLRDGDRSLMQIAEEVGYDSEAAFARAFKRVFGTPPATWRRLRRQGVTEGRNELSPADPDLP